MVHRGEIIERAVRESGLSITRLAQKLGRSRKHIYNIFETPDVSIEVVLQIGKIISYDFTYLLPQVDSTLYKTLGKDEPLINSKDSFSPDSEYWKNKYLELLEKYNKLLETRISH